MAIFKCKMCGGTIEFEQGATVGVCDSCGTRQTLPKLDDEQRANLYGRANHFRRNSDYDKAMGIYETILNEDKTDAEAYWSIVLCRYGIEYVEDPKTNKRIPTVNRAQYTSIFADADYQSALQYADTMQKSIYEAEARAIDDIQKGILAISQKEEPFDVFICYKETDEAGKRTPDSVLANDLYHQLTQEGFKVFFSRITLEDKLGSEYEPYIFAALNSAKVMVVLGTRPEYFNAVWVKNEWSRYLTLVKASDGKKMLIPAYKDMDPYDLPDAFSNLQAQNMSKLGFMQDLIRGIRKIVSADEPKSVKETVVVQNTAPQNANVVALKKRGFMALEDGEWDRADGFFEEALNQDAEDAECYLGKLMAELKIRKREQLKDAAEPFDDRNNCKKASRFDAKLAKKLADANAYIRERNETARKEKIYQQAVFKFIKNTEDCYVQAEELFSSIPDYKDADEKRKEAIYRRADLKCHKNNTTEADYLNAARLFASISDYKDAERRVQECREKAQKCREEFEERRKENLYKDATAALSAGKRVSQLESAIKKFESISDYKDAREKADECRKKIEELRIKQEQEEAERRQREEERKQREAKAAEAKRIAEEKRKKLIKKVAIIGTPIVAAVILFLIVLNSVIIPGSKYKKAVALADAGEYEQAITAFKAMGDYKNVSDKIEEIKLKYHKELLSKADVGSTVFFGVYEQDNDMTNGKEDIEWIVLDKKGMSLLLISKYAFDRKLYNTEFEDVTWETCTLRKWLNDEFLNTAFSAEEQTRISTTTVTADENPSYSINPGKDTQDKVFLMSLSEANRYFDTDSARQCAPTAYAIAQGAWTSGSYTTAEGEAACWWWLRSPGRNPQRATRVSGDGSISYSGGSVANDNGTVRPAMWINVN